MKLYLYNCNYQNEYLGEIQTDTPQEYEGTATTVPYRECHMFGASYAFNPKANQWNLLISDWRGITLYCKNNSTITKMGKVGPLEKGFIPSAPPDHLQIYTWSQEADEWELQINYVNLSDKLKQYEEAIQKHIDKVAQERGYDNGYTCASYYRDKDPQYASDAKVFKDWRSDVWVIVNNILNQYTSQFSGVENITEEDLQQYPSILQIINNLPQIEWVDVEVTQGE